MKEKPARIEIKNPCKQNWDAMPQVKGGLYCSQCAKVVTDFTKLSDEELIQLLSKKNTGETCGKFYKSQLDKIYLIQNYREQRPYYSFRLLLAGILTLPLSSEAQTTKVSNPSIALADQKKPGPKIQLHTKTIKGKVTNRALRTGINATIIVYADRSVLKPVATASTDSIGRYKLILPDTGLSKFFRIDYSSDSYLERTIIVDRDNISSYLAVSLLPLVTAEVSFIHPPQEPMGGVAEMIETRYREEEKSYGGINPQIIYNTPFYKKVWYKLKFAFRKTFRKRHP